MGYVIASSAEFIKAHVKNIKHNNPLLLLDSVGSHNPCWMEIMGDLTYPVKHTVAADMAKQRRVCGRGGIY